MKRNVSILLLCSFVLNCTYAPQRDIQYGTKRQVVVSERVGETIDSDEREHFDLFLPEIYVKPLTYQYESATIYAIPGGGYELQISGVKHTLVVVNKDPHGIDVLADYVDNHEDVIVSKLAFEEKWGIVDYDGLGLPITRKEMQITRKYVIAEHKKAARMVPAAWGGCIGMAAGGALAIIIYSTTEREIESNGGEFGDLGCLFSAAEETGIIMASACVFSGATLLGWGIGALVGRSKGKAIESTSPDTINAWVIDYIKEQRIPRAVE
jgi:hypothetical protein